MYKIISTNVICLVVSFYFLRIACFITGLKAELWEKKRLTLAVGFPSDDE